MAFEEVVPSGGDLTFISWSGADVGYKVEGRYRGLFTGGDYEPGFKVETKDGGTVVLNHAGQLRSRFSGVQEGELVQVEYLGKSAIESGQFKGTKAHQFKVLVDKEAAEEIF